MIKIAIIVFIAMVLGIIAACALSAEEKTYRYNPVKYWEQRLYVAYQLPDDDPIKRLKIELIRDYIEELEKGKGH